MAETASEAMERDDLKAATELVPGQMVKAAGEWFAVDHVTDAGDLILLHGGHRMFYAVGESERFVWHEGAF